MSTNVSKILTYYLIQSYLSKKKQIFYASVNDTFPGKFMYFLEAGTGGVLCKKAILANFEIFAGELETSNVIKNRLQ